MDLLAFLTGWVSVSVGVALFVGATIKLRDMWH